MVLMRTASRFWETFLAEAKQFGKKFIKEFLEDRIKKWLRGGKKDAAPAPEEFNVQDAIDQVLSRWFVVDHRRLPSFASRWIILRYLIASASLPTVRQLDTIHILCNVLYSSRSSRRISRDRIEIEFCLNLVAQDVITDGPI